jgi:uncharacterized protein (DUF697 family)
MARLPLSPTQIWETWKQANSTAQTAMGLAVMGDPGLVELAREQLGAGAPVRVVEGLPGSANGSGASAGEVGLVLVDPNQEDAALAALDARRHGAGIVLAVDEGPLASLRVTRPQPGIARVSFSPGERGWAAVWEALLGVAPDHVVALGRDFPPLRRFAVRRVITRAARQNGVVGVAFFIPGTDMPVMMLNQLRMVLALATMHEQELTQQRALEILGVVGAGLGFRTLARELLGVLPGPAWLVKGGIGYAGTRALGEAAGRYFEAGAPATPNRLTTLAKRLRR